MIKNIHPISSVIGQALKNKRRQLGLSGIELSKILSISQQQISRYENATSEISVSTLINILAVFNITPAEFFTRISDTKHDFFSKYTTGNW